MTLIEELEYLVTNGESRFGGSHYLLQRVLKELKSLGDWKPIPTALLNKFGVCSEQFILGHSKHKWVRFGRWHVQERRWYYSGTNERSQYAQVEGDDPTHWMVLPSPPDEESKDDVVHSCQQA